MLCIQLNACQELKCVYFKFRMKKRITSILPAYVNRGRARVIETASSSPDEPRLLKPDLNALLSIQRAFNWEPVCSFFLNDLAYSLVYCAHDIYGWKHKLFFAASRSFIDRENDIFNWIKLKISLYLPAFIPPKCTHRRNKTSVYIVCKACMSTQT